MNLFKRAWSLIPDPIDWFDECEKCKAEGWSNQRGHSTNSCLADSLKGNSNGHL